MTFRLVMVDKLNFGRQMLMSPKTITSDRSSCRSHKIIIIIYLYIIFIFGKKTVSHARGNIAANARFTYNVEQFYRVRLPNDGHQRIAYKTQNNCCWMAWENDCQIQNNMTIINHCVQRRRMKRTLKLYKYTIQLLNYVPYV